MQLLLIKKIDGSTTYFELIRKSDDPTIGMTYCCQRFLAAIVQNDPKIFDVTDRKEIAFVATWSAYNESYEEKVPIQYCPYCGEKFTYKLFRVVKIHREWLTEETKRMIVREVECVDCEDSVGT